MQKTSWTVYRVSDRMSDALGIRRGFTIFQLMTILEENDHSLILIECNPLLYEDAEEMTEHVSQALRERCKDVAVLLYAPGSIPTSRSWSRTPTGCFTSTKGQELRQGLLQRLIRRARRYRRPSHEVAMEV